MLSDGNTKKNLMASNYRIEAVVMGNQTNQQPQTSSKLLKVPGKKTGPLHQLKQQ